MKYLINVLCLILLFSCRKESKLDNEVTQEVPYGAWVAPSYDSILITAPFYIVGDDTCEAHPGRHGRMHGLTRIDWYDDSKGIERWLGTGCGNMTSEEIRYRFRNDKIY